MDLAYTKKKSVLPGAAAAHSSSDSSNEVGGYKGKKQK